MDLYDVLRNHPTAFCATIEDALHNNFDGWPDSDKEVIERFLADAARAAVRDYHLGAKNGN
jgi:hypothetical protein